MTPTEFEFLQQFTDIYPWQTLLDYWYKAAAYRDSQNESKLINFSMLANSGVGKSGKNILKSILGRHKKTNSNFRVLFDEPVEDLSHEQRRKINLAMMRIK